MEIQKIVMDEVQIDFDMKPNIAKFNRKKLVLSIEKYKYSKLIKS